MCHGDTYISKPQQKKIFCYKKIFRYKKIFASPIICYNQYRSLSISQKSVINIDKDGCQLRRRSDAAAADVGPEPEGRRIYR